MNMPNDPFMLLSFVNTKLRDEFNSFSEFAEAFGRKEDEISRRLNSINYFYDRKSNQFK